jgi:hypothetical protein
MARKMGNVQQEAALEKLLSKLGSIRGLDVRDKYKTVLTKTDLLVKIDLPDFPVVSIGRRGGFDMPEIGVYNETTGASDNYQYPAGNTAFDACLFGDKHVAHKGGGAANSSPYSNLPWEAP